MVCLAYCSTEERLLTTHSIHVTRQISLTGYVHNQPTNMAQIDTLQAQCASLTMYGQDAYATAHLHSTCTDILSSLTCTSIHSASYNTIQYCTNTCSFLASTRHHLDVQSPPGSAFDTSIRLAGCQNSVVNYRHDWWLLPTSVTQNWHLLYRRLLY